MTGVVRAEPLDLTSKASRPRVWTCFAIAGLAVVLTELFYLIYAIVAYIAFVDLGDPVWESVNWRTDLHQLVGILVTYLAVALTILIAIRLSPEPVWQRFLIRRTGMSPPRFTVLVLGTFFAMFLSSYVLWSVYAVMPTDILDLTDSTWEPYEIDFHLGSFLAVAVASSVLPSVLEELLFRGYIQSRLLQRWPAPFAIGVTSVLFGAYHFNFDQLITATVLGVWLGVLAWKTGSVWPGVVAHAAVNAFVSFTDWLSYADVMSYEAQMGLHAVLFLVSIGPGYLAIRMLCTMPGVRWLPDGKPYVSAAPATLDHLVADSLDTDIELLPEMSTLLAGLEELGGDASAAVAIVTASGDTPGRALDLGCGKGALLFALADSGWDCTGVDGYAPFLDSARFVAEQRGLSERCRFVHDDLRSTPVEDEPYDLVACCGVGPFAGGFARTVAALRRHVKPGGLILIDDAFIADDAAFNDAEEFVGYAHLDVTRRQLTTSGASIIAERISTAEETAQANAAILAKITPRAESLMHATPELEQRVGAWIREQRRQNDLLGRVLIPAVWLLRTPT